MGLDQRYKNSFSLPTGLSLVELLVSMVIAAVIFGGVVAVVQSSRVSFNTEQESSFIQENARYAVEILGRDIRHAGYLGCIDRTRSGFGFAINDADNLDGLYTADAVTGYEAGSVMPAFISAASPFPDSDAVVIRYADLERAVPISSHSDASIVLAENHDIEDGEASIIVDLDCKNATVFRNGGTSATNLTPGCSELYTDMPAEDFADADSCVDIAGSPSTDTFLPGSIVMPYTVSAYFIAESTVIPGVPALKRRSFWGNAVTTEELAQGVERMNITFGVDSSNDAVVNQFFSAEDVTAADDWGAVVAIRYELLFRSQNPAFDTPQAVVFAGEDINDSGAQDLFLRQVASSTIKMRNR